MNNINFLYVFFGIAAFIFGFIQVKFSNYVFKEEYFERLSKRLGKIDRKKTIHFEALTIVLMGVVFLIGGILNLSVNNLIIGIGVIAILYALLRKNYITKN
ncbi:MAG: hypothetical protein ACLUG9_05720 [Paraclostridium sordellii]|uniref:Phage protein n=1 Tax=Paraclostridium sordellii TaxID=1505 RepID=A0A9P1L3Y9_PARSO|nr:hypothetical protein [Paeniclostridium sordellii]AUN14170.1 hypothetical protein RSJ16_08025 [Paeniclostridium sordellii]MBS6022793.1 hypothetical protein [Paeniclostridium sordellii]MDU2686831.1 hypothetical protein [Paeniclostridium sordellii]MDU4414361.1 hypothetical protein [Paeniclostridium sordellii]MDU6114639.1 hypothetical protein [Paeniclostridium sordellii]